MTVINQLKLSDLSSSNPSPSSQSFFSQGVMFYIPHYLWKAFEHKKIDKITSGVRGKTLPINTDKRRDSLEDLINYLWETRGTHESYAFK